jgi:hypothetical protein
MEPVKWTPNTARHAWGSLCTMGKVTVGSTYRESGSRSDPPDTPRWRALCTLPGIKAAEERYLTEDEAKARVERQIARWFQWIKEA